MGYVWHKVVHSKYVTNCTKTYTSCQR